MTKAKRGKPAGRSEQVVVPGFRLGKLPPNDATAKATVVRKKGAHACGETPCVGPHRESIATREPI
jgi:hypothetical protein